jgi:peptidoglycan/LPS O-acetylase OafA/YrhL
MQTPTLSGPQPRDRGNRTGRAAFRPEIEGLRGVAVLVVVAFHCGLPGFAGGFVGVDVFFVLSGYLITGLLVSEIEKTSRLDLVQFYARRARRLLPASAVALIVTLLAGVLILGPNEIAFAARAARSSALYASNIFFAINDADYFAPDVATNPLLHTWSLAVEEQFYMCWPLLILLTWKSFRSRRALVLVLFLITAASLSLSVWFTAKGGTFAFYGLPTRAWEFGIGGLAILAPRTGLKFSPAFCIGLGLTGLLAIAGSVSFISFDSGFPGWIALIPVCGTVFVLVGTAQLPHAGVAPLLESAPMQILGTLSYSWYLWHWPFLVFAAAIQPNIALPGKIVAAVAALAVAALVHFLIENPVRFHPVLVRRAGLSLSLAAALTLFSVGAASWSLRVARTLSQAPEMKAIAAAANDVADIPRDRCVSVEESPTVRTCVFGNDMSEVNVALFGDSHAMQWFNPLRDMVEGHQWKLTTFLKNGCPATDISPVVTGAQFAVNCDIWRAEAVRRIVALRPTVVFIGNATTYLRPKRARQSRFDISTDEWRDGTRRTLVPLAAAGLRILMVRDSPIAPFNVPACLARFARHRWYPVGFCEINKDTSLNPAIFEAEKSGARGLKNVSFIDLTNRLCEGSECWASKGGLVVYRDDNHLTGRFASTLMGLLEAPIVQIVGHAAP